MCAIGHLVSEEDKKWVTQALLVPGELMVLLARLSCHCSWEGLQEENVWEGQSLKWVKMSDDFI